MARKILLADDSVTAQNMGRKILTDAGYDVVTVNNGSAALKRVAEQKPDLIVLDVYMPGYSGLEVCVRLKDAPDTARIPVLLTVGKLEPFKPEEAMRVRADAYIVKPFEASELLSALTRLEDRMVPQADGIRFSTTVSGIERFSGDPAVRKSESSDEDGGWKSRLRFPSKKKKEEPEPPPEEEIGVTPFRDFKKSASKTAASGSFAVNRTPPTTQEPGLVPDIPRDITPEELDALSELVAKLDGPIPAAENIAPLGEGLASAEAAAPAAAKQEEIKQEEAKPEAAATSPAEAQQPAETTPVAAEVSTEIPSVVAEAATEATPMATAAEITPEQSPAVSGLESSSQTAETAPEAVAQEPLAVRAVDESESSTAETPEIAPAAEEIPVAAIPDVSAIDRAQAEASANVEEVVKTAAPEAAEASMAAVSAAPEFVAATPPAAAPEAPEPSAEDLAEALRLLTPAQASSLAEAGAALVEELARTSAGPRWVAESVALNPEETSLSLEAEMFKSFAAQPQTPETVADSGASATGPVGHEEEEATEAAVEAAEAVAEVKTEDFSHVRPPLEETAPVVPAAEDSENIQPAKQDLPSRSDEEATQEDVAAVTFADAVRSEDAEGVVASSAADGSSFEDEMGGPDDMAKDGKGKGKWHQIHSTPETAAKADVVEAAKQAEEAPKAMAAAAGDSGAADASAIASIVDSVLADLKPKIVEEIAKKLGKK